MRLSRQKAGLANGRGMWIGADTAIGWFYLHEPFRPYGDRDQRTQTLFKRRGSDRPATRFTTQEAIKHNLPPGFVYRLIGMQYSILK